MFKKLSNTKLIGLLVVLVGVYAVIQLTGGKGRSKSFRATLVEFDTARVSSIEIEKGEQQLKLSKVGDNNWQVQLENGKTVSAKSASIKNALNSLMGLKPSRLASKDPDKQKDYQVDTAGMRVRLYEGEDKTLDVILGRLGVKGQQSYHTFVRLEEEHEIYAIDNFMSFSLSPEAENFRDQTFMRTKRDSIHTIKFDYPDSAFTLTKSNSTWLVDGAKADSTQAATFINQLSFTTNKNFVDDVDDFGTPVITVTIAANGEEDLVLSAYNVPGKALVLNSSQNPDAYFADEALREKFLKGKGYFLTDQASD